MPTFPRTGRFSRGYDVGQVDSFLVRAREAYETLGPGAGPVPLTSADVRATAFDLVHHGYVVEDVDVALDRLEDALTEHERQLAVAQRGREAFVEGLAARAQVLQRRLERGPRRRFDRAGLGRTGYAVADVDALCDRLLEYFTQGTQMSVDEVRRAVFRGRRWRAGYGEAQVDAFCDRAAEVMLLAE